MTHRPLTTVEVAAALNCAVVSVLELIHRGKLKAWRLNRRWRIEPDALEAFKQAQQHVVSPKVAPLPPRPKPRRTSLVADLPEAQYFT